MLSTRRKVARDVAAEIIPLEANINDALERCARLQIAIIRGQKPARLRLDAAQAELAMIADAHSNLVAVRETIHKAHYGLRDLQHEMGVTARDDFGDTGDTVITNAPQPALEVVGQAA